MPPVRSAGLRQCGVALITALLVVAIAGLLAIELVWRTNLDLRRTEGLLSWEQARQLGYGAEDYATGYLQEQLYKNGDKAVSRDAYEQLCNGGLSTVLVKEDVLPEGGWLGRFCDPQGRFNLNNLVKLSTGKKDPVAVKQFHRLLRAVAVIEKVEINSTVENEIVDSTVDWIDPDTSEESSGAEDGYYTGLSVPYQAANWWFTTTSELLAVKGMTATIYEALKYYVAALPPEPLPTKINVNSASIPVLMSLGEDVSQTDAEDWAGDRLKAYADVTEFKKDKNNVDAEMIPYLDANTNYMLLHGIISIGTTRLDMYSLLHRNQQNIEVVFRTFGSSEADGATADPLTLKDGKATDSKASESKTNE